MFKENITGRVLVSADAQGFSFVIGKDEVCVASKNLNILTKTSDFKISKCFTKKRFELESRLELNLGKNLNAKEFIFEFVKGSRGVEVRFSRTSRQYQIRWFRTRYRTPDS